MSEQDYSKRELDQLFKAADDRADEFHDRLMDRMDAFESNTAKSLSQILAQATKTNGRVTKLEKQLLITGTAILVVILLKIPELVPLLKLI